EFPHLIRLQARLLKQAAEQLRPGGVLVYSTCSIEPTENGTLVRAILNQHPELELELEAEATSIPGEPSDGGYWSRLRRRG
ncbi:MAG: 16S rRNA (cytosine(967)-C(5))-methyltransferase RsmB, partial [Gemmataceae bacterium]